MAVKLGLSLETLSRAGFRSMTQEQAERALREIYDTLAVLVGQKLAKGMTPAQVDTFERLARAGDDEAQSEWILKNIRDFEPQVQEELTYLEGRLRAAREARASDLGNLRDGGVTLA